MTRAVNLVACAILAACAGAQRPATSTDDVVALRDTWARAFNAGQLEAVMATYALDAVFLPITGGRVVSAAAIRNLFERIWDQLTPRIELTSRVVERSGDLAYDSGEYVENILSGPSATPAAATARMTVTIAGNYVFVYRRQPEGWRIVEQVWTEATGAPDERPGARCLDRQGACPSPPSGGWPGGAGPFTPPRVASRGLNSLAPESR